MTTNSCSCKGIFQVLSMVSSLCQIYEGLCTRQLSCFETLYAYNKEKGLNTNFDLLIFAGTRQCTIVPMSQVQELAKTHQSLG